MRHNERKIAYVVSYICFPEIIEYFLQKMNKISVVSRDFVPIEIHPSYDNVNKTNCNTKTFGLTEILNARTF